MMVLIKPEFDPDFPSDNVGGEIPVGNTLMFSANADEGWKFVC
jgi:hypothetical protein